MKTVLFYIAAVIWGVILGLTILWYASSPVEAAQSAVVSFNDAEHLAAISDSIVGVCDSTFTMSDSCLEGYTKSRYYGSIRDDSYVYYFRWIITCRELTSRTVIKFPINLRYYQGTLDPGKAIITWREVK